MSDTDTTLTDTERDSLTKCECGHYLNEHSSEGCLATVYDGDDGMASLDDVCACMATPDVIRERAITAIVAARVAAARAEHVVPNRAGDTTVRDWTPEDGDLRCQKCGHPNVVWFTDSTTWNSAMGNEGGVLCIRCFIGTYESQGEPVIWSLWREHPGAFSEFSRGLEAGRTSVGRFMAEARAEERARLVAEIEALPSRRIWPNRPSGSDSGFADGYSSAMADLRALIEGADGG